MSVNHRKKEFESQINGEYTFAAVVFLLELIFGIYLGSHKVLLADAMTRTANAFYVFWSLPRRLTSMGLTMNPLPSMLQLPFAFLSRFSRWLVTSGFSMSAVSAGFAAYGAKTLLGTFRKMGIRRKHAYLLTFLYVFNPYVFFYGANGMSEIMAATVGLQAICSMTLWMRKGGASHLIAVAFALAILFLIRYEAVPFAILIAAGMILHLIFSRRERKYYVRDSLEPVWYVESTFWITFLPIIYTILVWIFFNWSITGDAFYFLLPYRSAVGSGDLYGTISYVWARVWPFWMVGGALLLAKQISGKLLRYDTVVILFSVFGITFFTFYMIYSGRYDGYVRYLMYPMVFAVGFIPYVLRESQNELRSCTIVIAAAQLITALFFGWAFQRSMLFREDLLFNVPAHSEQLADYIDSRLGNKRILLDTYRTYYAVMNTENPYDLILPCNPDFEKCLEDPIRNEVDYIIVPDIARYGDIDTVNTAWPQLYNGGESWAEEIENIGEFKVFRVKR